MAARARPPARSYILVEVRGRTDDEARAKASALRRTLHDAAGLEGDYADVPLHADRAPHPSLGLPDETYLVLRRIFAVVNEAGDSWRERTGRTTQAKR